MPSITKYQAKVQKIEYGEKVHFFLKKCGNFLFKKVQLSYILDSLHVK